MKRKPKTSTNAITHIIQITLCTLQIKKNVREAISVRLNNRDEV